jgi:LacI family transcriptional regulator
LHKRLRKSTLRDVARLAGVDPSIVSRVLNRDPRLSVRPTTSARVRDAAQRLAYEPNGLARGLRLQRTRTLAMLIPDITNPIYATIIKGAEQAALSQGYNLFICNTGDISEREFNAIRSVVEKRVDGVLIATARREDDLTTTLRTLHLPYVLVNRRAPGAAYSVTADDSAGALLAVEHLIALGHRRIAHIAGALGTDTAQRRLEGFHRALRAAALPDDMVVEGGFRYDAGFAAMQRLLRSGRRPSAVFVANIVAALGALRAAKEAGVAVPAEISIMGFHDILAAEQVDPAITTVRMPLDLMGREAVSLLIEILAGHEPAIPHTVVQGPELLVRESTAALPADFPAASEPSGHPAAPATGAHRGTGC